MSSAPSTNSPLIVSGKTALAQEAVPSMSTIDTAPGPAPSSSTDSGNTPALPMDGLEHQVRNMILTNRPENQIANGNMNGHGPGNHQLTAPQRFDHTRAPGPVHTHYSSYPHAAPPLHHPLPQHHIPNLPPHPGPPNLHYSHHPGQFPPFNGQFPPLPGQFPFFHQQPYPQHLEFYHHHPGHERHPSDYSGNFNPQFHPPPGHPAFSPPITPFGPPPGAFPLQSASPTQPFYPPGSPIPIGGIHPGEAGAPPSSTPKLLASSPAIPAMAMVESRPPFPVEHHRRPHSKSVSSAAPPPVVSNDHFPPLGTQRPNKPAFHTPVPSPQQPHFNPNARDSWHQNAIPRVPHQGRPFPQNNHHPKQHHKIGSHQEQMEIINNLARNIIAEASPTEEENKNRNNFHQRLQELCTKLHPDGQLRPFGSAVSGFACTGADLDLIFQDPKLEEGRLGMAQKLRDVYEEAGLKTLLLEKTRVPILKLDETEEYLKKIGEEGRQPLSADIGFGNELAFINTKLLATYARCDPRLKEMVMFVKWWSKKRHINVPYKGTLSSYGYVLMVIHYLSNVARPPVLPNLQHWDIPENTPQELLRVKSHDGQSEHNVWFWQDWDEIDSVAASGGITSNKEELGSLIRGFFDYYTHSFNWLKEVISIRTRGGILLKEDKGWKAAIQRENSEKSSYKDRYLFAIEDPFETDHNISRTCNLNGVSRIRDEFRRALRLLRFREGEEGLFKELFATPREEEMESHYRPQHGHNGHSPTHQRNGHGSRSGPPRNGTYAGRRSFSSVQPNMNGHFNATMNGKPNGHFPPLGSHGQHHIPQPAYPPYGVQQNGTSGQITPPGQEPIAVHRQQDAEDQAALREIEKAAAVPTVAKPKKFQPLIVDGTPLAFKMKGNNSR